MKKIYNITILILLLIISYACDKEMDEYFYIDTPEAVDVDLMTLLKSNEDYSSYLSIIESLNIDTLFEQHSSVTMFVPTNDVINNMTSLYLDTLSWVKYLITESYINLSHIHETRKIQTLSGKFAEIVPVEDKLYFDGVEITKNGPLCLNGIFYELDSLAQPLPNLYEYIALSNLFLKEYIDTQDSSFLDLQESEPVGYDDFGNTVYDSVLNTLNNFEESYFPISEEFRSKEATMLLFTQEQFDNALNIIAEDLALTSSDQVPNQWKNDVLMPYLLDQGTFWSNLSIHDFMIGKLRNIKGDSVTVDPNNIDVNSAFECSNGKAYNYLNFVVADSLYKGSKVIQGEDLIYSRGSNLYAWKDNVIQTGIPVVPDAVVAIDIADNDSALVVRFEEENYANEFELSFSIDNVFPGRYRLLWRGKSVPSGVFQILVNNEVMPINLGREETDRVDLYDLRNPVRSITKEVFRAEKGYNNFDLLVENIVSYGKVDITIRYIDPGQRSNNGFILDYIMLESYSE